MIIEPGKFYKTRNGRKARIYATDGGDDFPLHGAVFDASRWDPRAWRKDGLVFHHLRGEHSADIIAEWTEPHPLANAKPGDVVWVRDDDQSAWFIRLFSSLEGDEDYPVIASDYSDLSLKAGWRYGKPYIPGEQP